MLPLWAFGQSVPSSNLDLFRALAETTAGEMCDHFALDQAAIVSVIVLPKETAWILEPGIQKVLLKRGFDVRHSDSVSYTIELGWDFARVAYNNVRRDGLFGPRIVDRTLTLKVSATVIDRTKGGMVRTNQFEESFTDTIALADVPQIEHAALPITRGTLPSEGFFTTLAEPLIFIGSIAIAVLLLFHVRS